MKFDFDKKVDRKNIYSMKWNVGQDELPMWVADMDFETAPVVKEAILDRAMNGTFGYTDIPDSWYEAYQNWWSSRHNFEIEKDWLIYSTGAIPTISSTVRKLTSPGEKVLVMTPIYHIFFNSIVNNGRFIVESPLQYENGNYSVDYEDLEEKLSDPQLSLMIMCNPHNPNGYIYSREELAKIGGLCKKYGVYVISDEVHCDLLDPGYEYCPFAAASKDCLEMSISCLAPSKTFNIAGITTSAVMVYDPIIRHKVWRQLNTDECGEPNAFAVTVTEAAFNHGGEWLDELRAYVLGNKDYVRNFIGEKLPKIKVVSGHATYMLWLDISALSDDSADFAQRLRDKTGLYVSDGAEFSGNGNRFLRINLACPRDYVVEAMKRLEYFLENCEF